MYQWNQRARFATLGRFLFFAAWATLGFGAPGNISAASFELTPIDFGDGVTVTGTVATDGSTGPLIDTNFLSWRIRVTSTSEFAFTPANSVASTAGVQSDVKGLSVATAPDAFSDGGILGFRGGVRFAIQVADFTSNSLPGGEAFFVNGAAFGFLSLNQPYNSAYLAATPRSGAASVFDLAPLDFGDGTSITGSIVTDGTSGELVADNLLDWNIVVREVTSVSILNERNSRVFAADGLSTDGQSIFVANPDGGWSFAQWPPQPDLTVIQLADFTDSNVPGGQALFTNPFYYELLSPLSSESSYVAASLSVPEPNALLLATFSALVAIAAMHCSACNRER